MFTDWTGGIVSFCRGIEFVVAIVSVLMMIGAVAFREVPRRDDTISWWLRMRWYVAPAVLFIAVYPIIVNPRDVWLAVCLTAFFLTNFLVTPLVERHNAARDREV